MTDHSKAHRIRLAGPWRTVSAVENAQRTRLPFRPDGSKESLIVSRSFNGSAGMLDADKVYVQITFEGSPPYVQLNEVTINPETASPDQSFVAEITQLLKPSNALVLNCGTDRAGQVIDVCLLISEQAAK